jgi:hypothetical protein
MTFDPSFIGVDSIGESLILNELINNYKSFLDWGFLNIGAFTNVKIPTNNIHNFNLHILKPTIDNINTTDTVWQTPRKDWIYESGVSFSGTSPTNISGVYVNSTFYPAPTGNASLGYKINYPDGRIIFNRPLPSSTTAHIEYSYRNIQVYKMEEFPYWKEIQQASLENKTGFSLKDKGDFSISGEKRVQLPAIIIEPVARSSSKPFHLGDVSQILQQDLLLHVLCDNSKDKNNIVDILRLQKDRVLSLYNTDQIIKDNIYPLNYDGSKNINGQNYNIFVNNDNHKWIYCRISDINISDMYFTNIRMYGAVVRITNELIILQNDNSAHC